MSTVKDDFISRLVEELNDENEFRISHNENPLDICYMVSVLDQQLDNCSDFMNVLKEGRWVINGYRNNKIRILIEKSEKEMKHTFNPFESYHYYINFMYEIRHQGYCECSPEDEGYNKKHDCCGNGCDWDAPAFRIEKVETICSGGWEGLEKDYWKYEDHFNEVIYKINEMVEQYKKEKEKTRILETIKELQNELDNLNLN